MKLYDKLKAVEKAYNMYEIDKEEAIKQADMLINEFNERSKEIAKKYKVRPTRISLRQFAFGR